MLQWLRRFRRKAQPEDHFWVIMDAPDDGPGIDGVVSASELAGYLRSGYGLRSKMGAVKAEVVEEVAVA